MERSSPPPFMRIGACGLTYAEMGRYATEDGDPEGTNDPDEAATGPNGQPLPSPARNTAFQASALQTSLYSSFMGFKVSDFVQGFGVFAIVVGTFMIFAGVAFSGAARILFGDGTAEASSADRVPATTTTT